MKAIKTSEKLPTINPITRARRLRRDSTVPERKLWSILRNRQLAGLKFRRQHPTASYIVDFVCVDKALIVEVDGDSHDERRFEYDMKRQRDLENAGYRVLRVSNDDVLNDIEAVARAIMKAAGLEDEAEKGTPHPNPLPSGEREQESPLPLGEG